MQFHKFDEGALVSVSVRFTLNLGSLTYCLWTLDNAVQRFTGLRDYATLPQKVRVLLQQWKWIYFQCLTLRDNKSF